MTHTTGLQFLMLFGLVVVPSPGFAQRDPADLSQMSIEDLMRLEVTSVPRKEERAVDVAAAVFVITNQVIRQAAVRYGGTAGAATYRLFAQVPRSASLRMRWTFR